MLYDEKVLLEKQIYSCEEQFTNNIPNSASNIFKFIYSMKGALRQRFLDDMIRAFESVARVHYIGTLPTEC
jgi:hypothetical protein